MKLGNVNVPDSFVFLGGLAALFLAFGPQFAKWFARKAAGAVTGTVVQGTQGAILGIAESVGIPDTDVAKCQQYVDSGDYWNASFYCPAGTFLKSAAGAIIHPRTGQKIGTTQPTGAADVVSIKPYTPVGLPYVPGEAPPEPTGPIEQGTVTSASIYRSLIR